MFDKMKALMEMKKQAEGLKRELDSVNIEVSEGRGIKIVIVISLFASLLVSITVTPVLASLFLVNAREVQHEREPRFVHSLRSFYRRVLDATLMRWQAVSVVSGGLLLAALFGLGVAGQAFLPDFNEGTLTVGAETIPGTALEESAKLWQMVEEVLLTHPEVVATARRTGRSPLDPHALD